MRQSLRSSGADSSRLSTSFHTNRKALNAMEARRARKLVIEMTLIIFVEKVQTRRKWEVKIRRTLRLSATAASLRERKQGWKRVPLLTFANYTNVDSIHCKSMVLGNLADILRLLVNQAGLKRRDFSGKCLVDFLERGDLKFPLLPCPPLMFFIMPQRMIRPNNIPSSFLSSWPQTKARRTTKMLVAITVRVPAPANEHALYRCQNQMELCIHNQNSVFWTMEFVHHAPVPTIL